MPIDYKKLYQSHDIILTNANPDNLVEDGTLESVDYLKNYFKSRERYKPPVDFSKLKNFARFGSAKKYYVDAFDRIAETYPYDGSLKERIDWELSSSYFDLYVFDQVYPRSNGYVTISAEGWGTQAASSDHYGATATSSYEYVFIKGGPHGSQRSTDKDITDITGDYKSGYANIWEPAKNRESNLKIGGIDGNTVEFWMKKSEFVTSKTGREVIFDAATSDYDYTSSNYGRLRVELTGTTSDCPIAVTWLSGTTGPNLSGFQGSTVTTSSIADGNWHHYAITLENSGTSAVMKLYFDGVCNGERTLPNSAIGDVNGNINATIGSLITNPSGTTQPTKGWGKLSGSLDEFRFWKDTRTSPEVLRYMIEPVGGGTNTDDANTSLGVYYKFNEGITSVNSTDQTVLDYSGRISNGTFVGYNSSARNVGSAMVSSGLVDTEFKDPILYTTHPDVESILETKKKEGEIHDFGNNAAIYHSLPAWITEEDEDKQYSPLKNLTQIVGSYFDSLAEQINSIPQLKHKTYLSSSHKPAPFNDRLLNSIGFDYFPELFSDATELEYFRSRNDRSLFEKKLYDVKNRIYQNIYNNIIYINKTKGTEKSFRNLIHCFGLGDEIYRINTYGNRVTYTLKDNYKSIAEFKKYVNFGLTGSSEATVFPHSASSNSNSKAIISASYGTTDYLGFTMESEVHFPIRHSLADSNTVATTDEGPSRQFRTYIPFTTASLFGMHQVGDSATGNNLTWASTDQANFQVFAVKASDYSQRAQFVLTGTSDSVIGALNLTSSYIDDVFDDTRWTFSVSVKPNSNTTADLAVGSSASFATMGYTVEFYGVEKIVDYVKNEFHVSGTITADQGSKFLNYPKAPYIGAHRTNFSGTLLKKADGNISSTRVWYSHLPTGTIKQHHQDVKNFGVDHPYRSTYLYPTQLDGIKIPTIDTLVLNWTFDTVTGSDSSGEFIGEDYSSGSAEKVSKYGEFGELVGKQYLPKGFNFPASSALPINKKFISSGKKQLPEMINSSDMVNILTDDDRFFNKVDLLRPTNYYTSIEKSMYQTISDEMVKMFSSIKDFNNLVGEPVNKYRHEYKDMEKLRQLFYERVGNTPDLDKYVDFYKWVDITLDTLLGYLVPASSDMGDRYGSNIRTMVENTVLHRNKYKWQYPTFEDKTPDIEGNILGINELLYNWEFGFHPLNSEDNKCLWWKERAERGDALTSGDTNVDSNKQTMLDSIINETNATAPTLGSRDTSTGAISTYQGSTYVTRRLAKPLRLKVDESPVYKQSPSMYSNKNPGFFDAINKFKEGDEYGIVQVNSEDVESFKDCNDDLALNNGKRKYTFAAKSKIGGGTFSDSDNYKGQKILPFNLYSGSFTGGVKDTISDGFMEGADITNLHMDIYGPDYEVPVQGAFTEKFVGGRPHRHIFSNLRPNNSSPDGIDDRPEGWKLILSSSILKLVNSDSGSANTPKSPYFREEYAKRPVNIKNIKMTTGSSADVAGRPDIVLNTTNIGNYTDNYEVVMTNGRSINNRYLAEAPDGLPTTYTDSTAVSGVVDFAMPRRDLTGSSKSIIVNRFSAPGDPATMGQGMLDPAAGEYSVYNSLIWRNLSVRMPLDEWYTNHANQFGFYSDTQVSSAYVLAGETYPGGNSTVSSADYSGTGSFHKVNRNPKKVKKYSSATSTSSFADDTVYDNWFVQHPIPRTDLQYAWITASVINGYSGAALYDYEQPDFSNASLASTDITFCSASDVVSIAETGSSIYRYFGQDKNSNFPLSDQSPYTGTIFTDFVGLNTIVYEPITSSENNLGWPHNSWDGANSTYINPNTPKSASSGLGQYVPRAASNAAVLNSIILNRQGPYGWPSWKQIRGAQHPVMRYNYKNNLQTFKKLGTIVENNGAIAASWTTISQSEPPITSKFWPLKYNFDYKTSLGNVGTTNMWTSYGNEKSYFTSPPDPNITGLTNLNNSNLVWSKAGQVGETLQDADNQILAYDTMKKYLLWNTPEYINGSANPIETFHKLEIVETVFPREHYTYRAIVRQRENFSNNFWRDSRSERNTTTINSQGFEATASGKDPASMWSLDSRADLSSTSAVPVGSGSEGELQNSYSIFYSGSDKSTVRAAATYNRRIQEKIDGVTYFLGDTQWEAGEQSGYNPSYDTYSEFVQDVRTLGKDYGIVPEYRLSEHMEYHVVDKASDGGFFAKNPSWLSLAGATISSSNDPDHDNIYGEGSFYTVYANSDFMKYFEPINTDFNAVGMPTRLKLKCSAITKFLPYDGFYPSERTVQLAEIFSQSFGPNATLMGTDANWKTLLTPFFAPGIMYNSIKSGIAVDYPVFDEPPSSVSRVILSDFDKRIPFEAIVDPDYWLSGLGTIHDTEPDSNHGAIVSSGSFGASSNNLFKYAINNFMAEAPRFFLGGTDGYNGNPYGPLTTFASKPTQEGTVEGVEMDPLGGKAEGNFIYFEANKSYKMRIVCRHSKINTLEAINKNPDYLDGTASYIWNEPTIMMYNRAFNRSDTSEYADLYYDLNSGDPESAIGMHHAPIYGSSFGPPVSQVTSSTDGSQTAGGFEPYTPPYYNGYSHIEITYTPEYAGYKTISDVLSDVSASYHRVTLQSGSNASRARDQAMHLSSSVNWRQVVTEGGKTRWVIQPKWESPILDFKESSITLPTVGSGSVAKGMWHQYGSLPRAGAGVFLEIQSPSNTEIGDSVGDLADKLGFSTNTSKQLGQIPSSGKTVKEAVVAIPFYKNFWGQRTFFHLNRKTINWAIAKMGGGYTTDEDYMSANSLNDYDWVYKPSGTVVDMVKSMYKYSLPPSINFLLQKDKAPFSMVFFEFDHHFTQDDLVKMWQGILPSEDRKDAASGVQHAVSEIEFDMNLLSGREALYSENPDPSTYKGWDLLNAVPGNKTGDLGFPTDIQWMVFKVKQKAASHYYSLTADRMDDYGSPTLNYLLDPTPLSFLPQFKFWETGAMSLLSTVEKAENIYRYNWPYDFFSLVELAKIDKTIVMEQRKEIPDTFPNIGSLVDLLPDLNMNFIPFFDSVTSVDPNILRGPYPTEDFMDGSGLPGWTKFPEWVPDISPVDLGRNPERTQAERNRQNRENTFDQNILQSFSATQFVSLQAQNIANSALQPNYLQGTIDKSIDINTAKGTQKKDKPNY